MSDSSVILVIEDDPAIRLGLRKSLGFEGYEVHEARGRRARPRDGLRAASPDLVVLDLMLPRVNGYEVCRTIRKHDPTIPILILSAKDDEGDKLMGFDLGADDYVTKPFSTRELVARVKAALRRAAPGGEGPSFEYLHMRVDFPGAAGARTAGSPSRCPTASSGSSASSSRTAAAS